ncbi:MAG: hypothetical protein AB7Q27_15525 [Acidimicrobiia bacterium]
MLKSHEIESLRRSQAMAPLSAGHVHQLLDSCAEMARERDAIAAVLAGLASPFGDVRRALNDLHRIMSASCPDANERPTEAGRSSISSGAGRQ